MWRFGMRNTIKKLKISWVISRFLWFCWDFEFRERDWSDEGGDWEFEIGVNSWEPKEAVQNRVRSSCIKNHQNQSHWHDLKENRTNWRRILERWRIIEWKNCIDRKKEKAFACVGKHYFLTKLIRLLTFT